jgi:translocator protein
MAWLKVGDKTARSGFGALTSAVAAASSKIGAARPRSLWYRRLRKPPFQPPAAVFPIVWSALYATVAESGFRVWRARPSRERDKALQLWFLQLGLNAAWSPLFFRLHKPKVALADSVLLLLAAGNYARHARRVDESAAWLVAPYVGWLGFATLLNAELVRRN